MIDTKPVPTLETPVTPLIDFSPKKIYLKDKTWHVDYSHNVGGMPTKSTSPENLNFEREPCRYELDKAVSSFLSLLIEANQLDEEFWLENGEIKGISLKQVANNYGVTIFGCAKSEDLIVTINQSTAYINPQKVFELGYRDKTMTLVAEIELYVKGVRSKGVECG